MFVISDPDGGNLEPLIDRCDAKIMSAAFSPDGRFLACGNASGKIRVWDQHASTSQELNGESIGEVLSLAFSHDNQLAAGGTNGVLIWESLDSTARVVKESPRNAIALQFSNGMLAIGGRDKVAGAIKVVDVISGESYLDESCKEWVRDIAFSDDGSLMAFCEEFSAGVVRIVDTTTWSDVRFSWLHCHSGKSTQLAFAGERLVTGCDNNSLRFWDLAHGELVGTLHIGGKVRGMKFLPNRAEFATVSDRGALRIWDAVEE